MSTVTVQEATRAPGALTRGPIQGESRADRPPAKISDIKVHAVKGRHWPRFPMVFVEVETNVGLVGLGEVLLYRNTGVIESLHQLRPLLIGRNPFEIQKNYELLSRRNVSRTALSGVEMALWDILGQASGLPIYQLLGGACREGVRLYADGFFRGADYATASYGEYAGAAVEQGFTALKMDVDSPVPLHQRFNRQLSSTHLRHAAAVVGAVRAAVGPLVDLAVDPHGSFDVPTAIRLGHMLEPFGLMWYEDPVQKTNLAAVAQVARAVDIPVCTGGRLTRYEYRELFELKAADIIMPDVIICGGYLEMMKIAALADTHFVPVAPHNMVGPVSTIASAHLSLAIPNFMVMEYQLGDVEWIDDLISAPVPIRGGHLWLSDSPGLGVSLNHAAVAKYRAE